MVGPSCACSMRRSMFSSRRMARLRGTVRTVPTRQLETVQYGIIII